MGVFDEGCMGMYNAIIEDNLLNPLGVYKERLSQSALVAGMREVTDEEAQKVRDWLDARGHDVQDRASGGDGPDGRADSGAVQDVHCGDADCGGVRMRRDRDPVSAGAEGYDAGVGPGGGAAE